MEYDKINPKFKVGDQVYVLYKASADGTFIMGREVKSIKIIIGKEGKLLYQYDLSDRVMSEEDVYASPQEAAEEYRKEMLKYYYDRNK